MSDSKADPVDNAIKTGGDIGIKIVDTAGNLNSDWATILLILGALMILVGGGLLFYFLVSRKPDNVEKLVDKVGVVSEDLAKVQIDVNNMAHDNRQLIMQVGEISHSVKNLSDASNPLASENSIRRLHERMDGLTTEMTQIKIAQEQQNKAISEGGATKELNQTIIELVKKGIKSEEDDET